MASSKKWASITSSIASCIYFLVIFFQIPLFRVPCRIGICKTPIEVISSQLFASQLFPAVVVKALLYPGAVSNAILKKKSIPSYNNLLKLYKFTDMKKVPSGTDLHHLEVLAGSYLSVAGALLGLIKQGRMSLFGTNLVLWGLVKEVIFRKNTDAANMKSIHIVYPTMSIALVAAFLSIKRDVRKIIRSCKAKRIKKSM